jgi:CopG-like RHH_1 or ribbon-helix-helix domain, RHH_5
MAKRDHQVSVPLPADLREFVERAAEQEDRTIAGQIRHLVAEAARVQADRGSRWRRSDKLTGGCDGCDPDGVACRCGSCRDGRPAECDGGAGIDCGGGHCVSSGGGHVGDGQLDFAGGIVDGTARAWCGCPGVEDPSREVARMVGPISSPDRRRIRLRRWIRLVIGILNAKAAIACAGQLALRPRCEPAALGAGTFPAARVDAPGIDDHGGTWPCTCSQCEDDPGHQTRDI